MKFTEINDGNTGRNVIVKKARYVCPVTNDILSNAVPCAVLKTSLVVVTVVAVAVVVVVVVVVTSYHNSNNIMVINNTIIAY